MYKTKKERYIKHLSLWGKNECNRKHAYRQVLRIRRQGDAYPEIKPDVDSMTEASFWEEDQKERIKALGVEETNALMKLTQYSQLEKAKDGLKNYVGDYYTYMNEYLRNGQKFELLSEDSKEKLQEKDGLEKFRHAINAFHMQKMSHQLVTRRYVGINTLRFMFGTSNEQEAPEEVRRAYWEDMRPQPATDEELWCGKCVFRKPEDLLSCEKYLRKPGNIVYGGECSYFVEAES